jgi:hypothetical protein
LNRGRQPLQLQQPQTDPASPPCPSLEMPCQSPITQAVSWTPCQASALGSLCCLQTQC